MVCERLESCDESEFPLSNWELELENNITTIEQLKEYTELTPRGERQLKKIIERHPMSLTRYYINLIDWNDQKDPIRNSKSSPLLVKLSTLAVPNTKSM